MKPKVNFFPDFLNKIDRRLLLNYPKLWVVKIHYWIFLSLVSNIGMLILGGLYPISGKLSPDSIMGNSLFFGSLPIVRELNYIDSLLVFLIFFIFLFLVFLLKQRQPEIKSISIFYAFLLFLFCGTISNFCFTTVMNQRISNQITPQEFERFNQIFREVFYDIIEPLNYKTVLSCVKSENQYYDLSSGKRVNIDSLLTKSNRLQTRYNFFIFLQNHDDFQALLEYEKKFNLGSYLSKNSDYKSIEKLMESIPNLDLKSFPVIFDVSKFIADNNDNDHNLNIENDIDPNIFFYPIHLLRETHFINSIFARSTLNMPYGLLIIIVGASLGFIFYNYELDVAFGGILLAFSPILLGANAYLELWDSFNQTHYVIFIFSYLMVIWLLKKVKRSYGKIFKDLFNIISLCWPSFFFLVDGYRENNLLDLSLYPYRIYYVALIQLIYTSIYIQLFMIRSKDNPLVN